MAQTASENGFRALRNHYWTAIGRRNNEPLSVIGVGQNV
jgi:hypothetical protein